MGFLCGLSRAFVYIRMYKIFDIEQNSIAYELEIEPGDTLLSINKQHIKDILDYRFLTADEFIELEIEKQSGEIWELEIEKDYSEDIGLIFETPLIDKKMQCKNACMFCFIDQQPPKLRDSLYIKDDDYRLCFLMGNYITLTNINEYDLNRIIKYHLSPMRISVHTVDPTLRAKIMGNKKAGELFKFLDRFKKANITMHFQVVLMRDINDKKYLDDTIETLYKYGESLSIVPCGITKYRKNITPFDKQTAKEVIEQVHNWQKKYSFVYLSDEWYILAEEQTRDFKHYNNFPQLENGVGMLTLFEYEFDNELTGSLQGEYTIVTGAAAYDFIKRLAKKAMDKHNNLKIYVIKIINNFFGENITVSGLLTGEDIIKQVNNPIGCVILPPNAFKYNSDIMLDGMTIQDVAQKLNCKVIKGADNGKDFVKMFAAN